MTKSNNKPVSEIVIKISLRGRLLQDLRRPLKVLWRRVRELARGQPVAQRQLCAGLSVPGAIEPQATIPKAGRASARWASAAAAVLPAPEHSDRPASESAWLGTPAVR
jgi:hypothetical protein